MIDVVDAFHREASAAKSQAEEAARNAEGGSQLAERLRNAEDEREQLRGELAELKSRLESAEELVDWFRRRGVADPTESEKQLPRRTRVEGEPNLFFTLNAAGEKVYEIVYQLEGKKKHETIGTDFDKALERREELRSEGTIKTPNEETPSEEATPTEQEGRSTIGSWLDGRKDKAA